MDGINVNLSNYYMLHVWVLDDMKFIPDVFAGQMPCITGGSAIHDSRTTRATPRGRADGCGADHSLGQKPQHRLPAGEGVAS